MLIRRRILRTQAFNTNNEQIMIDELKNCLKYKLKIALRKNRQHTKSLKNSELPITIRIFKSN